MIRSVEKRWAWLALVIILLVGGWFAVHRLDEPAWEMSHHGFILSEWPHNAANYLRFGLDTRSGLVLDYGWVSPPEGFTFRIDHPPVTSWAIALSYAVFGINEWSARLVPVLSSLALVVLVFRLGRSIAGPGWALLAAVFAIGSPAFLYFARLPVPHVPAILFALGTFMLYRQWVVTRNGRYLGGMWACFAIGAWTDWVVYFVMPWILVHYILFHHRRQPDRRFLVVSFCLPLVLFFLYVAWTILVAGVEPWSKLLQIFRWRAAMAGDSQNVRHFFTWGDLYELSYNWVKLYATPTLCVASLVWVVAFAARLVRRTVSSDEFLVLCLFLYGLTHNLVFTNRVYFHSFISAFEWIPFFALASALGVRVLGRIFTPPWRLPVTVVLVVLTLFSFFSQSTATVTGLHKERLEPDYYLVGRKLDELVPRADKVLLSFRPDIRFLYYADRPWATVTTLDEYEAVVHSDESYSYYVLGQESGVSDELRRFLIKSFPVVNSGHYALFNLRGTGEKAVVEVEESLAISHPVNARFGDRMLLLGYDLEPEVIQTREQPGWWESHLNAHADLMPEHNAETQVTYYWRALEPIDRDYEVRTEFVAGYGEEYVIDQTHKPTNGVYPTSMWREGDVIREVYAVYVPSDDPPLQYSLRVSVVDSATGETLPVSDVGEGRLAGENQLELGRLGIEPYQHAGGETAVPEMNKVLRANMDNGLTFEGYRLAGDMGDRRVLRGGQTLKVTTSWLVDDPVVEDYPAWLELASGRSRVRTLLGLEPTRLWEVGERYLRQGEMALSLYLLPGRYDLSVVVGEDAERRAEMGTVEVGWAADPRRVIDQMGVPDGEKGDVRPLDTDRTLRLNFSLDEQMGFEVVAGWTGEALCEVTRVEVHLGNRYGERYLTTWEVPRGEQSVTSARVPQILTSPGTNNIILRVPEELGKPHYVGWRAWVDAVFPDLLYDLSGPHDGWIWADFIQVASDWTEEWGTYRDLAQTYNDLEMYGEAASLFADAVDAGLRPGRVEDARVFLEAFEALGEDHKAAQVDEALLSLVPERLDVNLDDKVEVVGYSLERTDDGEGRLRLFFRCLQPLDVDYTLWLHQYEEGSEQFTALDRRLSTSRWRAGRLYEESWAVELSTEMVRFVFGLWRWEDGSRLWVKDEPGQHEIDLGWITPR